jgi:hypothetical protein
LDFFVWRGQELIWQDLGLRNGLYAGSPTWRVRLRPVDADRNGPDRGAWLVVERTVVDLRSVLASRPDLPFVEVEVQVDRGDGYSASVFCWLARDSRRVVEVRRERN